MDEPGKGLTNPVNIHVGKKGSISVFVGCLKIHTSKAKVKVQLEKVWLWRSRKQ